MQVTNDSRPDGRWNQNGQPGSELSWRKDRMNLQRPSGREAGLGGDPVVAPKAARPPATLYRPSGGKASDLFSSLFYGDLYLGFRAEDFGLKKLG
jgi:hypothetical protein